MGDTLRRALPSAAAEVLDRLSVAGPLWLIGGAALAWLAGRRLDVEEVDAISALPPERLRALGGRPIGGVSETHVWRAGSVEIEVSPLRGPDLRADLMRREFTIAAIAVRWPDGAVVDPFGGRRDRELRRLRTPPGRDPFAEDPLRILRGWRRVAEGYRWTPSAAALAVAAIPGLRSVPRERLGRPWRKLLVGPRAARALAALEHWPGLLAAVDPRLAALAAEQAVPPGHRWRPWRHTIQVVAAVPPEPAMRFAALLHDLGKVAPRLDPQVVPDEPPLRIADHAAISARLAEELLVTWGIERSLRRRVVALVAAHTFSARTLLADPGRLRAWFAEHEALLPELLWLRRADRYAAGMAKGYADLDALAAALERLRGEAFPRSPARLAVPSGELCTAFAVPPQHRSRFLDRLWRWVLVDPERRNRREAIMTAADRLARALAEKT